MCVNTFSYSFLFNNTSVFGVRAFDLKVEGKAGEEIDQGVERIMVDEKTGVEYVLIENDGGITPRIDKNGKPVINQQWLKKHQEKELQKKINRELQKYTVHN